MKNLSYVEINKSNLIHNFEVFRNLLSPDTKIVSVVKANAYGHGQDEVVKILEEATDYFQVDDLQELRQLRKVSNKPTLVLGYVAKDELREAIEFEGILGIYDLDRVAVIDQIAKELNKKAKIHIKIDANLGRQGVLLDDLEDFVSNLKECQNLEIEGVYSHFANIEDTTDFSHAQKQIDSFEKAVEIFKKHGYGNILTHISATSGVFAYEKGLGISSLVRIGIGLYGMWPSKELEEQYGDQVELKPALRWITHVAQIKNVPANYPIGYGLTYITEKPTKIAIIPQGYSDGYDRGFSGNGEVIINGKRCRILGRVAMNMFAVDVTHLETVKQEDEVALLGTQENERITAEELAEKIETINYEITTRINPLLTRVIK